MSWIILGVALAAIITAGAVIVHGALAAEQHFNAEDS